jgi:predicted nucleic acid-binding protein
VTCLLDTSVISALMREDKSMASWLASLSADDLVVTWAIARGEIPLCAGAVGSGTEAERTRRQGREVIASHGEWAQYRDLLRQQFRI